MKIAMIDDFRPAIITADGAVDVSDAVPEIMAVPPVYRMAELIERWTQHLPTVKEASANSRAKPLSTVRLRAPVPRPAKLLCAQLSFREGLQATKISPTFFLKSSTCVIGPGDTIELNPVDAKVFHHEAELALIVGKRAKAIAPHDALAHVFGYTCFMDISARGIGHGTSFQDKSYDTFGPMGPWIATADEIPDPHALDVKLWTEGELRHDYPMSDLAKSIPEMIAYASSIAALEPGDVLSLGVNHQGLGPIQDGELLKIEIAPIGAFEVRVNDSRKRRWESGVDRGAAAWVKGLVAGDGTIGHPQFAERLDS